MKLSLHWIVLTSFFLLNIFDATFSRSTSRSKKERTTAYGRHSTTPTTVKSLLDIPQNDIYNNKVEEEIAVGSIPVLKSDPYTRAEKSKISWDILNRNNAKKSGKSYTVLNTKIIKGQTGPQGPPGAVMTKDAIFKEFKSMIKSAARKRAKKIILTQCPTCDVKGMDEDALSFFYPGVEDRVKTINRVPMAFTTQLISKVDIYPDTDNLKQLKQFRLTGSPYGMTHGVPADIGMNGKFTIDKPGIYQFTATLNFHSGHKVAADSRSNFVQVFICPNGECVPSESNKNHIATQYIHSMSSRQRYFTVQLTAMIELKKSDYVSIYVKNGCRRTIAVQEGSLVTGIILSA